MVQQTLSDHKTGSSRSVPQALPSHKANDITGPALAAARTSAVSLPVGPADSKSSRGHAAAVTAMATGVGVPASMRQSGTAFDPLGTQRTLDAPERGHEFAGGVLRRVFIGPHLVVPVTHLSSGRDHSPASDDLHRREEMMRKWKHALENGHEGNKGKKAAAGKTAAAGAPHWIGGSFEIGFDLRQALQYDHLTNALSDAAPLEAKSTVPSHLSRSIYSGHRWAHPHYVSIGGFS